LARQQEDSTPEEGGQGVGVEGSQERFSGCEKGEVAARRRIREGREGTPDGPGLTVGLVKVRVP
jgi:hypothetical protein